MSRNILQGEGKRLPGTLYHVIEIQRDHEFTYEFRLEMFDHTAAY